MLSRYLDHNKVYYLSLIGLAISMPLSVFFTSLFEVVLVINWILELDFYKKIARLRQSGSLLIFLSIYLVFVLGMLYSDDLVFGFHDLKIKLPLLILPLIIGTSPPLDRSRLKLILVFLAAACFAGSIASISVLFGIIDNPITDVREISLFISHIRFALLINISIFSLIHFILNRDFHLRDWEYATYSILIIWLIIFIFLLQAVTGVIVLFVTGGILALVWLFRIRQLMVRWTMLVFLLAVFLISVSYITRIIGVYYSIDEINPDDIEWYTPSGNPYTHEFSSQIVENGHHVYLYICEPELEEGWNRISDIDYDSLDLRGNPVKYILIRYLTSMDLKKDSSGISRLTPKDVEFIEQGKANYLYAGKYGFQSKVYEIIWQIDIYLKGGNPSGHSVTQRLEYLKASFEIIKENLWFGVGTGDVPQAFKDYYAGSKDTLDEAWQLRTHNQLVTFILSSGIIGFIWIIVALLYPVFTRRKWDNYFVQMFLLIAFLSMLNEDTLETSIGVAFFVFFYSLFLFGTDNTSSKNLSDGN